MKRLALAFLLCVIVGQAEAAVDCTPQTQIDVSKIEARAIVVGELHGTAEIPAFVGSLACSLARQGRPVVLALERQGDEQAAFDAYMVSDGGPAARAALLGQGGWTSQPQFGLASEAMLALVEQMRQLRQAGAPVAVLAMLRWVKVDLPAPQQKSSGGRATPLRLSMPDRLMADSIAGTVAGEPDAVVIALAGGLHTATIAPQDQHPMAQLLSEMLPTFIIGIESTEGGTAWNCNSLQDCGPHRMPAQAFVVKGSRTDATVRLGRISASPPAVSR